MEANGNLNDKIQFELDSVRVQKIPGGQLSKSFVVDGMVIPRDTMGVIKDKEKVKIAVYGNGVDIHTTEQKGTVLLENQEQLLNFSKGEEENMGSFIAEIQNMGVGVIISGGPISELQMHFMDKYKILVVKIGSKFELRRLCKSLKCINVIRNGPPVPEEIGYQDSVNVEEIQSQKVTIFRTVESAISTIVLRGATASTLEEWERQIADGISQVRSSCKDGRYCAGGQATEMRLVNELTKFGQTVPGLDQYQVIKFAEQFEIVPKILQDNAGYSRVDVLTRLYKAMASKEIYTGLNLTDFDGAETTDGDPDILCDSQKQGVLDHLDSKIWAVRHALESVLTVLRVDHIIMARQAGGNKEQ